MSRHSGWEIRTVEDTRHNSREEDSWTKVSQITGHTNELRQWRSGVIDHVFILRFKSLFERSSCATRDGLPYVGLEKAQHVEKFYFVFSTFIPPSHKVEKPATDPPTKPMDMTLKLRDRRGLFLQQTLPEPRLGDGQISTYTYIYVAS